MELDDLFLQSLVGGVAYFRYPDFEPGPDLYYLFRYRIIDMIMVGDEMVIFVETFQPSRFTLGEWSNHYLDPTMLIVAERIHSPIWGNFPRFKLLSESVIYGQISSCGEIVFMHPSIEEPDVTEVFKHFPLRGYESAMGALGDLRSGLL